MSIKYYRSKTSNKVHELIAKSSQYAILKHIGNVDEYPIKLSQLESNFIPIEDKDLYQVFLMYSERLGFNDCLYKTYDNAIDDINNFDVDSTIIPIVKVRKKDKENAPE